MFLRKMSSQPWHWLLLGLIMLVAFTLRIWGLGYGLPYIYHVDEHYYVNTALKLGTGLINNPPYAPTGLSNLLFGEYAGYYLVGKLSGIFASAQEFEAAFRRDPSVFYLFGRFTSALLSTATCMALYLLGKSTYNSITGLVAAGFLAVSFIHVRDSHYSVPDASMTFFVTLTVMLTFVAMRTDRRWYIYLGAISAGLAVAMKWSCLPIVLLIGWASLWVGTDTHKNIIARLLNWSVGLTILFFVLGLAVGAGQMLINPAPYIREAMMLGEAGRDGGFSIWQVDTLPGWLFYGKTLLIGVGPILLILGIIGLLHRLVMSFKAGGRLSILLWLFPLIYFLIMSSTHNYFARYSLPLVPFVALFAAETLTSVVTWTLVNRQRKLGWALAILLAVGAITGPLIKSIQHDILLTHQDTRTLATQWIDAHIPAEAKIVVDWPTFSPPLSTAEKVLPGSHKVYDVMVVGNSGLSKHSLAWYREQGYDYLISSSFISNLTMVSKEWNAERRSFYSSLDQNLDPIQEFWPFQSQLEPPFIFDEIYGPMISIPQRERPGPVIRIYKLH
jgi:hypothetical protein